MSEKTILTEMTTYKDDGTYTAAVASASQARSTSTTDTGIYIKPSSGEDPDSTTTTTDQGDYTPPSSSEDPSSTTTTTNSGEYNPPASSEAPSSTTTTTDSGEYNPPSSSENNNGSTTTTTTIHVQSVKLSSNAETIAKDETVPLTATVYPANASNKEIVWSSNSGAATVDSGLVTGKYDGTATITVRTLDGSFKDTCTITVDSREKIIVKRDGEFNKIIFQSSNKEWLCINYDMINDPDNLQNNKYDNTLSTLRDRLYTNTYKTIICGENMIDCQDPKSYTDNEKKLLYLIDPYGFAAYVQEYGRYIYRSNLAGLVAFKDSVFETLFNQSPKYFARDDKGEWYDATSDKEQLSITRMLSESELIFGTHNVYDLTFGFQCFDVVLKLLALPVAFARLKSISVLKGYTEFLKRANLLFTLSKAVVEEDYNKFIETIISEANGESDSSEDTKSENFNMNWAKALFELSDSFGELAEILAERPTFYEEIFERCATDPNYRIFFEYNNGTIEEVSDISNKFN